jgi:hypothetical protein
MHQRRSALRPAGRRTIVHQAAAVQRIPDRGRFLLQDCTLLDLRTVAVVLDERFSWRLSALAERVPVWIIDSADNRPAIESLWDARRKRSAGYDVTVFRAVPELSTEDHLAGVLRSVDSHRDDESAPGRFQVVEMYGIEMTESIRSVLRRRGFDGIEPVGDGYRARLRDEF